MGKNANYKVIIGLEVHAQLNTKTKIFSTESTKFGMKPNTQVGAISIALPGTLPKLNKKVIEFVTKMGLACHCDISRTQYFDRKNYFYPDLPKGYQITQDGAPACRNGYIIVRVKGEEKKIMLEKIHCEEDAGKLIHQEGEMDSKVDFNRAGMPLIEIVTKPMLESVEEVSAFMNEVRKIVRYLEISNGNMEEGSMRCDANVSVMEVNDTQLGNKVEVKNMNSIRNIRRAVEYETERQKKILESGNDVVCETRTFDVNDGKTYPMRLKEELNDYRYFPDPDLSPIVISDTWLEKIKSEMPKLPEELYAKFISNYGLSDYDAQVLTDSKEIALFFEEVCNYTSHYKTAANWIIGPAKAYWNEQDFASFSIKPKTLASLIELVEKGGISFTIAKQKIFPELLQNPELEPEEIAHNLDLFSDMNDQNIVALINELITEFPMKLEEFKKGKKGIIDFFMGELMRRCKGKADPRIAQELLMKRLRELKS